MENEIETKKVAEPHKKDFKEMFEEDQKKIVEEKEAIDNTDFPSIRERLMNRSKLLIIDVPMRDTSGDFSIKCRAFTVKEQDDVFDILNTLRILTLEKDKAKPNQKKILDVYHKTVLKAHKLLAYPNGISLMPELDLDFWTSGNYTSDMPFYVMRYVIDHQSEAVRNAVLFREDGRRKIPEPTVPNAESNA